MNRTFADLLPTPLADDSLSTLSPLTRADDLLLLLTRWVERGWLRSLDKAFVAFLHELSPEADPLVLLAAALTSHQLGHGHVCLDLFETLNAPDFALSLPPEGMCKGGLCCCRRNCSKPSTAFIGARCWRAVHWSRWRLTQVPQRRNAPWCCPGSACICAAIGLMNDGSTAPCVCVWRRAKCRRRTCHSA